MWVCLQMGVDPKQVPAIEVAMLQPREMVILMCKKPEMCENFSPVYYDGKRLYIMENDGEKPIDWKKKKFLASIIVHNMVHHVQKHIMYKGDLKEMMKDFKPLEEQAQMLQERWLERVEI